MDSRTPEPRGAVKARERSERPAQTAQRARPRGEHGLGPRRGSRSISQDCVPRDLPYPTLADARATFSRVDGMYTSRIPGFASLAATLSACRAGRIRVSERSFADASRIFGSRVHPPDSCRSTPKPSLIGSGKNPVPLENAPCSRLRNCLFRASRELPSSHLKYINYSHIEQRWKTANRSKFPAPGNSRRRLC